MSKITITNNRPGGFGIPDGPVIEAGQSMEVDAADWAGVEDHPVVKAWVDAKHLTVEGSTAGFKKDASEEGGDKLDRDELKKQASELGLEYAGNISNVKLKELIDAKLAS